MTLPTGPFQLILADPPWATLLWSGAERTPTARAGADHYSTMSLDALKALPVADIAAPDAQLVMWVIGTHLDQAFELGRAWGFTYSTDIFYWLKQKRLGAGQLDWISEDIAPLPIGMGKVTRKQVEPALLFKRGKGLPVQSHSVRQAIVAPKREHSRKPDETFERLDALYGTDITRLEMFSRTPRAGWTAWGNEVGKFEEEMA